MAKRDPRDAGWRALVEWSAIRQGATLAIALATYALLAVPALARRLHARLDARHPLARRAAGVLASRPGIALAGGAILVLLGLVGWRAALDAIDLRTLALLLGMMLLVAALDAANVFAVIASRLVRALPTPVTLLAGSMVVVALLSALVLNDAVVLLFTPVLVRAARDLDISPFPLLAGEAIAANLGSAATPTGNPQNAAIALEEGLSFVEFVAPLLPLALLCLALGVAYCLLAFRKELAPRATGTARYLSAAPERVTSAPMLAIALGSVSLALVGFVAGPRFGVPLWASALGAGLFAIALAPAARVSPLRVARGVDPGILVFFVGLFVLMEGISATGIVRYLSELTASSAGFVVATAALSNLVSNVPAVLLLLPGVETTARALLLAAASTYAGNLTFFGSAATIIVAETARSHGAEFDAGRFTLVGAPLAVGTLVLAWLWLG